MSKDFGEFIMFLVIFSFLILFWEGFTSEMNRGKNVGGVAKYNPTPVTKIVPIQQGGYQQVYINNLGGPATVYYIRQ